MYIMYVIILTDITSSGMHKKAGFVCRAADAIKASLFGLLTANSKICSERFHSHIFSPLSNVWGLSDKSG